MPEFVDASPTQVGTALSSPTLDALVVAQTYLVTGAAPAPAATLAQPFPSVGVVFNNGATATYTSIAAATLSLTASADNYIDATQGGAYASPLAVGHGAAPPAVAAGNLRVFKAVTAAGGVSSATLIAPTQPLNATQVQNAVQLNPAAAQPGSIAITGTVAAGSDVTTGGGASLGAAYNTANAAQASANSANNAAATAQASATTAQTNATNATNAAGTAQTSANAAQTAANVAQTAANNAQSTANSAQAEANTSVQLNPSAPQSGAISIVNAMSAAQFLVPGKGMIRQATWALCNANATAPETNANDYQVADWSPLFVPINMQLGQGLAWGVAANNPHSPTNPYINFSTTGGALIIHVSASFYCQNNVDDWMQMGVSIDGGIVTQLDYAGIVPNGTTNKLPIKANGYGSLIGTTVLNPNPGNHTLLLVVNCGGGQGANAIIQVLPAVSGGQSYYNLLLAEMG